MPVSRPTTLLAHDAPGGRHYDWLIDPPHPPEAGHAAPEPGADLPRLWTTRVELPWDAWPTAGVLTAHALPPHRRRYLDWSGELSGGRGRVQVAARGRVDITRWGDARIDAILYAGPLVLGLALSRPSPAAPNWRVTVAQNPAPPFGAGAIR